MGIGRIRVHALWAVLVVGALGCPAGPGNTSATLTDPGTTITGEASTSTSAATSSSSTSPSTSTATEPGTTTGSSTGSTTSPPEMFHCGPEDGGLDCFVGQLCVNDSTGGDLDICPWDAAYCHSLPPGCTEDDPCAPSCGALCNNFNCPVDKFLCGEGVFTCAYWCDSQADCKLAGTTCKAVKSTAEAKWHSNHCMPTPDPGAKVGEPCVLQDGGDYWSDTCEAGAVCWPIDPDTMKGTCKPQCALDDSPACDTCLEISDPPDLVSFPSVNVCVSACDPLMSDCAAGEVCVQYSALGDGFVCLPQAADVTGAAFEACEYVNGCDPGLVCKAPDLAPMNCDLQATGCCLPLCDTTMPQCPPDLTCQPWYGPGEAPPGLEDVGLCQAA